MKKKLKQKKSNSTNIKIAKTIKLFIGGDFPRTESGRSQPIYFHKTKDVYAQACLASRKDLRNAVTAGASALHGWQNKSAYNRSQILYRMAEMMEAKREEFKDVLTNTLGLNELRANKSVDDAIDALIYFSGFADKYQQILGAVNPVSGPHHNFTSTESVGLVGLICDDNFILENAVAQIAAIIVSGNSLVALMTLSSAGLLAPLAEVFVTSDLPKGVVNLLSGSTEELYTHFGNHMEVQSLSCQMKNKKILGELKIMAAANMKRITPPIDEHLSLNHLAHYLEFKTVWHPIGQ